MFLVMSFIKMSLRKKIRTKSFDLTMIRVFNIVFRQRLSVQLSKRFGHPVQRHKRSGVAPCRPDVQVDHQGRTIEHF